MIRTLGKRVPDSLVDTGLNAYIRLEQALDRPYHSYNWEGYQFKYLYADKQSFLQHWGSIEDGKVGSEGVPLELLSCSDKADGIIDVGAHQGLYTVILGVLNSHLPLVAVEPIAENTHWIRENVKLNGIEVEINNGIVSDTCGEITFYEDANAGSERHTTTPSQNVNYYQETAVESTTISIIASRIDAENPFLKIDAEGEEQAIIEELCNSELPTFRGIVEFHPDKLNNDINSVLRTMDEFGVSYKFITESSPNHTVSRPMYYFEH
jgi:FkbM family methyltransferase